MKICRFISPSAKLPFYGILDAGKVNPISETQIFGQDPSKWRPDASESFKLDQVVILPPVKPSKIVCVGRNYAEHAAELGNAVPKEPLLFLKAPSSLLAHEGEVVIPGQSSQVEHEGELAVVISKNCSRLSASDNATDFILGYTCLNDVTARDIQRKDVQFTRGKSFDTFCPVGPFIETDLDTADLRVSVRVNGILKQDGKTSQMVFPVDHLIRYISNQMTLEPGDIVATGTPAGVSKLNGGDVCEVEIEGIGILRNKFILGN